MPKPAMEFPHNDDYGPSEVIPHGKFKSLYPDQIELDAVCAVRRYQGPGADNKEIERIGLLADSFWEHGQAQPILVRPPAASTTKYRLIAGERRWRAAQRDGLELACYVRDVDDTQARALAFEENYRRKNFSPVDMALLFIEARKALGDPCPPDWSEKVAAQFGVSRATVTQHIKVYKHFAGDPEMLGKIHIAQVRMNAALAMLPQPKPNGNGNGASAVATRLPDSAKPEDISSWIWYDRQTHADLKLWQECLLAVYNAGAKDVVGVAEKKYDALGGIRLDGLTRGQKARIRKMTEEVPSETRTTMPRAEARKPKEPPADRGVPLTTGMTHEPHGVRFMCACGFQTNWHSNAAKAQEELHEHFGKSVPTDVAPVRSPASKSPKSKNR